LYRRADPYLSIGSVAIDDETAAPIVEQLRKDAQLSQPPELKFAHFKGQSRLEVLAGMLGPGGPLAGRTRVYLVDKHYFVASKIIDLLLEEEAHARGINLYENDLARRAAWTLFTDGPRALGAFVPVMEPLIAALPLIANLWSVEIGALSMLTDEHKVLTDERLDIFAKMAALDVKFAGPGMGARRRPAERAVRAVLRGVSRDHPSIQLADLVAGAGREVARRHAGVPSAAGDRLYPFIVPVISPESLVPHDDPARFAAAG
jgi:hypothetical protein